MRKLYVVLAVLVLAALMVVPAFAQERGTLPEQLAADGRFGTLLAAVEAAGLTDALSGEGPLTLIAPTDDAIAATLETLGMSAEDLLADTETLTAILTYHVIPERLFFRNLTSGPNVASLQGEEVDFDLTDGVFTASGVNILDVDNLASNGIFHVAEGVLLPPSLVEAMAAPAEEPAAEEPATEAPAGQPAVRPDLPTLLAEDADGRFTTLLAAVEAAGLGETLAGEGPFTIFAPTNDAFAAALETLGVSAEDLLGNTDLLTQILLYHVVPERLFYRNLTGGQTFTTALGETIRTEENAGGQLAVNNIPVSDPDALASNGIVHAIDGVLLPASAGINSYVRVAHFSPDAPAVDIYVNGAAAVTALEFGSVTDWVTLPVGVYDFAVVPTGSDISEAVLELDDLALAPNVRITAAARGSVEAGTFTGQLIGEDYDSVTADAAQVTVFHAIEGAPAVNVTANGATVISDLGYPGTLGDGSNDGVFTISVPAGTYDLAVVAGGAALLSADDVALEGGVSYFIAAIGTPDAPELSVTATTVAE